jgi:hypothetical protein
MTIFYFAKQNWKSAAICLVPLAVVGVSRLSENVPAKLIQATGFRLYVAISNQYLANCNLHSFEERGVAQQLGLCQSIPRLGGWRTVIIYDSTGELAAPLEERTKAWRDVALDLPAANFMTRSLQGRTRIFESYYAVNIPFDKEEG